MTSGDPRKQPRPDGAPTDEVTKAYPPTLSMVMTEVEVRVVPFGFPGGKAIDLCAKSGDLQVHMHFPLDAAEVVCEAITQAAMKASVDLVPASLADMQVMTNGAKAG